MKQVTLVIFILGGFLLSGSIWAQEKTVRGTVEDHNGVPLPGVNVIVKDTEKGTITDFDGNFSLLVSEGETLLFSMIGFTEMEVVVGDQDRIQIELSEDAQSLGEVVVTALGIKREEKTLTSAQQSISADEISKTKQANFVNNLSGKVSGLEVKRSAAGAGGSSRIVLRGNKSLEGVSKPLFVIDGIPMLNNSTGGEGNSPFDSRDNGDGLSQINPDDIESVTVLKGANSAALYGSQGANGVILITTKSGEPGKLHGSVSSSTEFQSVIELPKMQYRYGQKNNTGDESWSDQAGSYDRGFAKGFFDTGVNLTNSLSLSGGSENSMSYFSYANTSSQGIVPSNDYLRNNVTFKQTNRFFDDRLQITSRVMLADENMKNRPPSGYYFNAITGVYLFPRNMDFNAYKNYEIYDENRNLMTQNWFVDSDQQQNPYWILNNDRTYNNKKRLIANVAISYDLTDKMSIQVRGNYDYLRGKWEQKIKAGTVGLLSPANGRYRMNDLTDSKIYGDAIFTYADNFNDFSLDVVLGASIERTTIGDGITTDSHDLKYVNIFTLQNLSNESLISQTMDSKLEKQGVFGNVRLGYNNYLFLDLSGRNDWSSSLAFTDNSSYFYPAVGFSALLSDMMELPDFISFAKLRGSYSVVSTEVPAFFSRPLNTIDANGIKINTEKPFEELKPEDQYSLEIGADFRLFRSRLNLDITYYRIDNKNQFIPLDAPSGSGYSKYFVNAGHIRNSGFEIALRTSPIKTDEFTWNTTLNFASNKNDIIALHPELKGRYQLSNSEGYASYITEGGHFSDIYTYKFERDAQGRIVVNDQGEPQRTSEPEYIGESEPKFIMGWNNSFSYKNWGLSFLVDAKVGGKVVGGTEAILDSYGVSERSGKARDVGHYAIDAVDGSGNPVTSVDPETFFKAVGGRDGILENYVYNATNVRLSEVALSHQWDFPSKTLFKSLSVSLIANNLFFLYKDAPFDPEIAFNPGNTFQGFSLFNLPPVRTYGINLNLKF